MSARADVFVASQSCDACARMRADVAAHVRLPGADMRSQHNAAFVEVVRAEQAEQREQHRRGESALKLLRDLHRVLAKGDVVVAALTDRDADEWHRVREEMRVLLAEERPGSEAAP